MKKVLFIVDAQNDFCHENGSLNCQDSSIAVKNIIELLHRTQFDMIYTTYDTHKEDDYLESIEGKHLPIKHCIKDTWGQKIHKGIYDALYEQTCDWYTINKETFMVNPENIANVLKYEYKCEIYVCGFATDICVINNALLIKGLFPDRFEINVIENCCAGTSAKNHDKAIELMKVNHINIL